MWVRPSIWRCPRCVFCLRMALQLSVASIRLTRLHRDDQRVSRMQSFWSRLAGKYGNKFYWQEKGEAASILNTVSRLHPTPSHMLTPVTLTPSESCCTPQVSAIDSCLREEPGRAKCSKVQGEFGEGV